MQDLLDVSIPAVVLIPLLIVCVALWRCFQWSVRSSEVRRAEFLSLQRLAKEEQDRAEREYEQGYNRLLEYLRQRQGAQQRSADDYRVDYRSQPAAGFDHPRRLQLEQDYRYADTVTYPTRQDEEANRRRRWVEERREAEAEEFRIKQAEEYNRRKQAAVEELRRKQAQAEEEERRLRETGEAEIRKRLAEAERTRIEEEFNNRRRAEEEEMKKRKDEEEEMKRRKDEEEEMKKRDAEEQEMKRRRAEEQELKRRQAEADENNKKAELEARAKKLSEENEITKKKAEEIIQNGTQVHVGRQVCKKVYPAPNFICIVCLRHTKRRCARCKGVFYCSRECQLQHWNDGHKDDCRILDSSSSPGSSNGDTRKFSDVLSSRSSRSDTSVDETVAPSLSPALSPAPSYATSAISHSAPVSPQPGSLLKTSSTVSADGRRLKPKKILFPYDDFIELFDVDIKFLPCGLSNCGNSCFANAVLQCLTYTQPLISYLLRGDHGRQCNSSSWCFMCALQEHAVQVKQSRSPFSPRNIVSQLRYIGRGLDYGKQEDAHEFMSYAIHLMQSICLDGAGGGKAVDACTQETTLIHHIFGGLLQSQVRCMQCRHQSNRYEITMDLAVEIQGNVGSVEDALRQFTAPEILDGENKYKCDRCDAYVEACKQITIHEAPNILIVTLKRFKTGRFGKLSKQVAFSEVLDMNPYMSENGDRPPLYTLYAVVVHVDELNAAYYGHYICLVKNPSGYWYRIDDAKVTEVDVYRVTSQQAYMLLYKRSDPRPTGFTDDIPYQAASVAQDWHMSNRFAVYSQPQHFSLHMSQLVSSTITDRSSTVHVPIGIPNYFR